MNENYERSQDQVRGFTLPRWLIVVAAALALIVVAGTVALKVLFPPDKLRAMIVPRIEEKVGSEVALGDIRLQVFPRIAVRLDDFAVANPPGFSDEPALRLAALELQVALWPLLRKQVELGRVRLLGPEIRYEVLADGTSNLSLLGPPEDTAAVGWGEVEDVPAAGAAATAFVVSDLALSDGTVHYSDGRNGRVARMNLDARLQAERVAGSAGAMAGRGTIELSSIHTRTPEAEAETALPDLEIAYAMLLDLPGDSLALEEVEIAMGDVAAVGSGAVRGLMSERSIDFALESGDVDIAAFLAGLPAEMRPQDVEAAGRMNLSLAVQGPFGGGAKPQVNGTLGLESISASYGEYAGVLSDGSGELRFDLESASLPVFTGELLGKPFELSLSVSDFETRQVDGRVSGEVDLGRLAELREGATPMEGAARFDLSFSGPAQQPERLRLNGPIELSGVSYQSESLAVPARIAQATIRLTGSGVAADAIPVRLGESDLNLAFDGPDLLSYALSRGASDATPHIQFAVTSQRLDISELTVPDTTQQPGYSDLLTARLAGKQVYGRDPGELARERYAEIPPIPPVNADGRVRIAEFLSPPTRAQNISFNVVVRDGVLQVRNLAGGLYGGTVSGALTLDFSRGRPPFGLDYDLQLSAAQAGDFVQQWTRLGRAMSGLVDFNVSGSTSIDEGFLPAPDAIDATGRASFRQGRFEDFGLANALAGQLKLDATKLSGFDDLGGPFEIEGGNFLVQDWTIAGTDAKGVVGGSAGLGGSLDLNLDLELPMETLERAGLIEGGGGGLLGNLLGQLAGGDDAIQIAVGIGGTMSSPAVQLDSEALAEELERRFGAAGRNLLQQLIKPPPR
ncbi:MAG: AsmA family protein [Gemmatimonadota bacterium]|nr:MAG: AsmA family protein [Gemmatimonadota bacterium]